MRTKAFEDAIRSKLGPLNCNWLNEIGKLPCIGPFPEVRPKRMSKKKKAEFRFPSPPEYPGVEYHACRRYDLVLDDYSIYMTVTVDDDKLRFEYFLIDPESDECMLKQYERAVIMRALRIEEHQNKLRARGYL